MNFSTNKKSIGMPTLLTRENTHPIKLKTNIILLMVLQIKIRVMNTENLFSLLQNTLYR